MASGNKGSVNESDEEDPNRERGHTALPVALLYVCALLLLLLGRRIIVTISM